jgi:hypothetical protein
MRARDWTFRDRYERIALRLRRIYYRYKKKHRIYPKNRRVNVEEWNNEKLLLLVKR